MVGVSPQKSRIWAGPSRDWADFVDLMWGLLGLASEATPETDPLPVLATLSAAGDATKPYDVSIIDPILLTADGDTEDERREEAERWANRASFTVTNDGDPLDFSMSVELDGVDLGELRVKVTSCDDGTARTDVSAPDDASPHLLEAKAAANRPNSLTIRYESGHTLNGERMFSTRFVDRQFSNWRWMDFNVGGRKFEVRKEKPYIADSTAFDPAAIGTDADRSLFSWTALHWPDRHGHERRGWMASDDGAGEIADFIHIDSSGDPPMLSLIHVKGSKSAASDRQISTSDYELVVGQAVKNLRFLDLSNLADQLSAGREKAVAAANWHDGQKGDARRADLIRYLRPLGSNVGLQVVIVQPRVTKKEYEQARSIASKGRTTARVRRLRQLDALLLEAQAACRSLGAELVVVGDAQGK